MAAHALVTLPSRERRSITVDVVLPGHDSAQPVRTLTAPVGEAHIRVQLVLAASTPPGAYDATVHTSQGDIPAVVLVKERLHLMLVPSIVRITAPPGGEVEQHLTVFNAGNVACAITENYVFGLFESEGLESAVAAGLMAERGGLERVAEMADSAAGSHGGLVRVTVRDGAGILDPGAARAVVTRFRFAGRLKPGRQYFATWRLHDLRTAVFVDVVQSRATIEE